MSEVPDLERRYRRLLAWYPSGYRSRHGEEMIGVLIASAHEGQRRPQPAEALDLIAGGLRIRLRAALGWRPGQASRDALAIFSVCMPVIWLISLIALYLLLAAMFLNRGGVGRTLLIVTLFAVVETALMAIPLWLGWRGRQRAGAISALLAAGLLAYLALSQLAPLGWMTCYSLLFAGEAAALVASPGPRRGAELMTGKSWAVTVGTGLVIAVYERLYGFGSELTMSRTVLVRAIIAILIVTVVAAGLLVTLPRKIAGRLLLLFAAPLALGGIGMLYVQMSTAIADVLLALYLPALSLATLTIMVGLIPRRWRRSGAQAAGS
jgi:hypothetical protein